MRFISERLSQGLIAIVSITALAGCVSNPVSKKEYAEFKSAPLSDAEVMPSEVQLRNERIKVVVIDADESAADAMARSAQVGSTLSQTLAATIGSRGVDIIDKNLVPKLGDQLLLAESRGTSSYKGPSAANFAIKASLTSSKYGATYSAASEFTDKKGKVTRIPATYSHRADVVASVRIYEMPSLKLVTTLNLTGVDSSSMNSEGANNSTGVAMLRRSAGIAVNNSSADLLNVFAGKGYVGAKKFNGKKSIFQITMGTEDGLKPGDKVMVYSVRPEAAGLRKDTSGFEEVEIAETTVTENISVDQAWVAADDEATAKKISRGDVVKAQHKDGFFTKGTKLLQGM